MLNDKRIEIIVSPEGEVKIEAFGYRGKGCTKATQPLTKALVGTPTHEKIKNEYYQHPVTEQLKELQ